MTTYIPSAIIKQIWSGGVYMDWGKPTIAILQCEQKEELHSSEGEAFLGLESLLERVAAVLNITVDHEAVFQEDWVSEIDDKKVVITKEVPMVAAVVTIGRFLRSIPSLDGVIYECCSMDCPLHEAFNELASAWKDRSHEQTFCVDLDVPAAIFIERKQLQTAQTQRLFLTRLYALTKFHQVKSSPSFASLTNFHRSHKYLFMSLQPMVLKKLGGIVANADKRSINDVFQHYEQSLLALLSSSFSRGKHMNALQHMIGYFSKYVSTREKKNMEHLLQEYKDAEREDRSILHLLYAWAKRYNEEYILEQTIFRPYPEGFVSHIEKISSSLIRLKVENESGVHHL